MEDKYSELNRKTPTEVVGIIGNVEKYNYLAHTIREIQLAILKTAGINYHITTYVSANSTKAKITFYDRCCEIRLPCDCEEMDDIKIRQILAHELGHLVYNIDKLKEPEIFENLERTDNEELFVWEFAFHLIKKKSDDHRNNKEISKHIFTRDELKRSIITLVRKKKPAILDELNRLIK
jgi:hypothetical protein